MKAVRFGMALLILLLMTACTMKQAVSLNGKWRNVGSEEILEFTGDGVMTTTLEGVTSQVSYRFTGSNKIEFYAGSLILGSAELRVDPKILTLVDARGKHHRYEKIR